MNKMRSWSVLFTLLLTLTSLYAETKRYEIQSGIIEYTSSGSGNMMGIKTQMSGTNKVIFKEWGNIEIHHNTTKSVVMGRTENTKDTTKITHGKVLVVDYDQKIIVEYDASMLMHSEHRDLVKSAQEMINAMGGKKIGEESVLGYSCEVWEMPQMKLWLHKGIALRSEANMMGITNTMEATKVQFDVSVSDDQFKLPDFPIKTMQEAQIPQMTPEQMQQMQEMMKSFTQK